MRQVHFVAFLQAQNCTTLPASWRHPDARTDTYSPEYYQHIARVLEEGREGDAEGHGGEREQAEEDEEQAGVG